MSNTPILNEAICQVSNLQEIGYTDVRVLVADAFRAALPWEPPDETIEAMAREIDPMAMMKSSNPTIEMVRETKREKPRSRALAAYRVQPIMRELYPEHFGKK